MMLANRSQYKQSDASQSGLGAALLHDGQPVCYASCSLTATEMRYVPIEKEMLAIVRSCNKFDQYLYGRDTVNIESDHEPLRSVFKKEIHKSLNHPQHMRLALQKYNLDVKYKKGPLMHIADTLGRAYLRTTERAQDEFCEIRALENVDHEEHIRVEDPKRNIFKEQVAADPEIQGLISVIKQGWPAKKRCPATCSPLL